MRRLLRLLVPTGILVASTAPAFAQCEGANVCQAPDFSYGYLSSVPIGLLAREKLTVGAHGSISDLCWWGFGVEEGTNHDCGETLTDFTVTYYNDDGSGSCPGSVKGGPFAVHAVGTPDGATVDPGFNPRPVHKWAGWHPSVRVEAGETLWVEVKAADAVCTFFWGTSDEGDGSFCWGDETVNEDLAFTAFVLSCPLQTLVNDTTTVPPALGPGMLARGYRLRDGVLAQSPAGRGWIARYYRHANTVSEILRERPGLRRRMTLLVATLGPGLDALTGADDSDAGAVAVPPRAVALLAAVCDELAEADVEGELTRDLELVLATFGPRELANQSFAGAWSRVERGER